MRRRSYNILLLTILFTFLLGGCNSAAPSDDPIETPQPTATATATAILVDPDAPLRGQATVDSIQIELLESFPIQVNVLVRGTIPDTCSQLDQIVSQLSGTQFKVIVTTLRDVAAEACTLEAVPFEERVSLDVEGLDAGTYDVDVNGSLGSFTFDVDNRVQVEPTATSELVAKLGGVNGRIFHDLCAPAFATEENETNPPAGCVALDDDGWLADGEMGDDEPGIAEVTVSIGEGECPAVGLETAVSDDTGSFSFNDLTLGDYCISIDVEANGNGEILIPGQWTAPTRMTDNIIETTVNISENDGGEDANFGWDYQFLPVPEIDPANCQNAIQFVEDLNIPDDTAFLPGTEFVKSWRLRNSGSCTWTTDYNFVFAGDAQMDGPDSVVLETAVMPNQTVDISVPFTAPDTPGTYRSDWVMSNAEGTQFGVDGPATEVIWVQVIVDENAGPVSTPIPGTASISGLVWRDFCRLQSNGAPGLGCVETFEGSGVFRADSTFNFNEAVLEGIVVGLSEGSCPDTGLVPDNDLVETAVANEEGIYTFSNLNTAIYCVSINAFREENLEALIPGDWTHPFPGTGLQAFNVQVGEEVVDVDFGWDDAD